MRRDSISHILHPTPMVASTTRTKEKLEVKIALIKTIAEIEPNRNRGYLCEYLKSAGYFSRNFSLKTLILTII